MQMNDLLAQGAVKHLGRVSSKKRLLTDLAHTAADAYSLDAEAGLAALQERESLGPTGVGNGVALPHARLPGLDSVQGVFFRLDTPLEYDAADRRPVDLIFALFAPEDAGVAHLKALALVSRTLRNGALLAKLRANSDVQILHTLLTDAEASAAA
ncbi:PTS sugar transporter subunit IIA [Jannaschia aquimarina]|uniref:PtsN protein n=1 Tax=Jannaschia aquimarina TaxID=935700 RepID=A0A0D1EDT5_9RHOB|nr:PTS sugar transporter subunit IIA [Jannaschia aquimarina]KIT15106.1 Nitrogen regulatory protein [Jannaschia aquimarina]SNS64246.1 PTS IIA-like nitrogen-regulatory protein PtsN [Jannaschia aquimarina]